MTRQLPEQGLKVSFTWPLKSVFNFKKREEKSVLQLNISPISTCIVKFDKIEKGIMP